MAVPTKGTELLDLVRKSGLLDQPKINGYVTTLEQQGQVEEDPGRLASRMVKDGLITVFQARQMLRGRYRGFFLGKYKVLEPIGSGGMADVYLCEHMAMRHKVAVKILPIEKLKDPSLLGRFRREAQAIATLNHPNIVRAFDLDNEGNLHYLVTEYVDGCNLQDFIKKNGPMVPERAANYIAQAAAGLQHILDSELVHRDIKPGNLLLDRSGVVKLLDLGLARFNDIERQDNLTRDFDDGRVLGTADYIAPEQGIKGSDVDIRADIYSLGATFYFMLKGEAPFEGATVTQKLLFHQIKEPPPLPDTVPPDIAELIRQMMAKKPANRIQTPGEIISRLLPYATESIPPLEEEMPPRSAALGAQPKSMGPKSSSRLSGRMAMTSLSHASMGSPSGRIGPRSGIDSALRATPHAGVNIPTTPNSAVGAVAPSVVDDDEDDEDDRLIAGDETVEAVNSFFMKYRWPLVAGTVLILALCAFVVYWLIDSTQNVKLAKRTQTVSMIPSAGDTDSEKENPAANDAAQPDPVVLPKWVSNVPLKEAPPAKSVRVTSSGVAGTFKTIKNALLSNGSDAHIVIMDPQHKEQLTLDGTQGFKNITIEGWSNSSEPVTMGYPPSAETNKPLITLNNIEGIKFKNLVLRGDNKDVELVKCTGDCPGLSIENVYFTNFPNRALVFDKVVGTPKQPVRLSQLKSATTREKDSVVRFDGICSEIIMDQCRFDGPFRGAVTLNGSMTNSVIKQCRFHKNLSSIVSNSTSDSATIQVKIVNCVFSQIITSAITFPQPAASDSTTWDISDNLFLNTKRMAMVRSARFDAPTGLTSSLQWLWSDEGQTPEKPGVKPGMRYFRTSVKLDQVPSLAALHVSCIDSFIVWVNGKRVGASSNKFYDQRVHRFDVTRFLTTGTNIIAVQGLHEGPEPGNPNGSGAAAMMACLYDATGNKALTTADQVWRVAREPVENWNHGEIDPADKRWENAKPWPSAGLLHWKNAVWDESITSSLGTNSMPSVKGEGNLRDYHTSEGFPNLNSIRGNVDGDKERHYGTNPDDDATFLRYPTSAYLMKMGTKEHPVGIPQDK